MSEWEIKASTGSLLLIIEVGRNTSKQYTSGTMSTRNSLHGEFQHINHFMDSVNM